MEDDDSKTMQELLAEIEELRARLARLEESSAVSQKIIESVPLRVFWKDRESRYLGCNALFAKDAGFSSPEELTGKTDFDMGWRDQADRYRVDDRLVMESGVPKLAYEEPQTTPDAKRIWLRTSKVPLYGKGREVTGVLGIYDDVTAGKDAEETAGARARLLDLIFTHTLDCVALMDRDFNFIRVSESYARASNRKVSDFPGKNHFALFPSPFEGEVRPFVRDKRVYTRHDRPFVFPDHPEWGTTYWDLSLVPILGGDGEVELLLFTLKDTTDRKRAELALKESEAKLRAILDNSPAVIYVKDMTGRLLLVNRRFEDLFRVANDDVAGKTDHDLFPAAQADKFRANDLEVIRRKAPVEFDETAPHDDGPHDYLSVKFPLLDADGDVYAVCGISTDVTDRKRLEEERVKTQKLESLGVLAGGIAHDFNNFLTGVVANLSYIGRTGRADEETMRRIGELEKAARQASGLTQQLLTFSRGGAPVKKNISVGPLIREAAAFGAGGSEVRCDCVVPAGLWNISADESQIVQVLNNLIINAKQASSPGGAVMVSARNRHVADREIPPLSVGRHVEITVADRGVGIRKEHLARIFEPYFTTKESGSGLGLASAYSIVSKHGGHISVGSRPGVGSTFSVYLPALRDEEAVAARAVAQVPGAAAGRVLVMDDDPLIRSVVVTILTSAGYEVAAAEDGEEALRLYREARENGAPFAVVIMDLTIPGGMGGKEAVKALLEYDPGARAIVSSGYSNDPVMADHRRYGFRGVMKKPYDDAELAACVKSVLEARE